MLLFHKRKAGKGSRSHWWKMASNHLFQVFEFGNTLPKTLVHLPTPFDTYHQQLITNTYHHYLPTLTITHHHLQSTITPGRPKFSGSLTPQSPQGINFWLNIRMYLREAPKIQIQILLASRLNPCQG